MENQENQKFTSVDSVQLRDTVKFDGVVERETGRLHRQDKVKLTDANLTGGTAHGSSQGVLNVEESCDKACSHESCECESAPEKLPLQIPVEDGLVNIPIALVKNSIEMTSQEPNGIGSQYQISDEGKILAQIQFQCGPIAEEGINGISTEELIAVALHRMRTLNRVFPSRENATVITKIEEALLWSAKRTIERTAAGIEGTSQQ